MELLSIWAISLLVITAVILIASAVMSNSARRKLHAYPTKTVALSSGNMTYVDSEKGTEAILVAHGINGGYDQAYESLKPQATTYRIIAPSRFGYPGSVLPKDASPSAQARAYAELLDTLHIEKAYIVGTSAGGTVAIRFALDYPEKTKGLVLYSSAAPLVQKSDDHPQYLGPPTPLLNDIAFTVLAPLFPAAMGLPVSAATGSMPLAERRAGILNDARVTNPDMLCHFDAYPIESLRVPTLIFHARDDRVASFAAMEAGAKRFPHVRFVPFDKGGHMMNGQSDTIDRELTKFISSTT